MIKNKERDALILLEILTCQEAITKTMEVNNCEDEVNEAVKNPIVVDLSQFYVMKVAALAKGLSKKTKDELEDVIDYDLTTSITASMQFAYPTVCPQTIVKYANELSGPMAKQIVKDTYQNVIGKGN